MIERLLERFLFASRWLLAPFYVALVFSLVALLVKMLQHLWHFSAHILERSETEVIVEALKLVDLALTGALIVIVIFSGYENFVSRIDAAKHSDWPEWMTKIDFSGLKLKLMSSIVAISGIQLLSVFLGVARIPDRELAWYVGIHLTFVVSALLLALSDRISGDAHAARANDKH
jgi:uncharacterized protein (TIGR00645 family)